MESVITGVMKKSDDRAEEVRFVYHVYDFRLNWTKSSYQLIMKITISEKRKTARLRKKRKKICIKRLSEEA